MKKWITITVGIFLFSCLIVILLFHQTKNNEILTGDFSRYIIAPWYNQKRIVDLKAGTYIAGTHSDTLYLASLFERNKIEGVNYRDGKSKSYFVYDSDQSITKSIVQYPYIFQMDDVNSRIVRRYLHNPDDSEIFKLPFFTDAIPLTKNSFAFRTYNDSKTELLLSKLSRDENKIFPGLLQKQIDGILCTDGMLTYNQKERNLFYTYYYRNQFLCLDTDLNLLYRGKTIDSISHVKIKVNNTDHHGGRTLGSPARLVNSYSHSSDSLLYILSHVVGKTESAEDHRKGSMIDCYRTSDGLYRYSIYLPHYQNQQLKEIVVTDSRLFALYRNHLIIYSLL